MNIDIFAEPPKSKPFFKWPFPKKEEIITPPKIPVLSSEDHKLIKESEGLRLNAYQCSANVWTIGFGSTRGMDGAPVKPGQSITIEQARALYVRDINIFSASVRRLVTVKINDNQFSALVSLAYNIGLGNFRASTLLRKLNRGDFVGCSMEFGKWRRANGKINRGLVARRERERIMFITA